MKREHRPSDVFDKIDEQDALNMFVAAIEGLYRCGYRHETLRGCMTDFYCKVKKKVEG